MYRMTLNIPENQYQYPMTAMNAQGSSSYSNTTSPFMDTSPLHDIIHQQFQSSDIIWRFWQIEIGNGQGLDIKNVGSTMIKTLTLLF